MRRPVSRRRIRRWTRRAGDAALRADPDDPEAIAAAIGALARRDGSRRAGPPHAARFTWRAAGEAILLGYEEAVCVRVGLDVSPLAQTRAGTARVVSGLSGRSRGGPASRSSAHLRRRRPGVDGRARPRLVSGRARTGRQEARRPPLHDLPRPPQAHPPVVVTVHDSRSCATRTRSRRGTGVRTRGPEARRAECRRRRRGLDLHAGRAGRARGGDRGTGPSRPERDRPRLHAGRPGRGRRLRARRRHARAPQEPGTGTSTRPARGSGAACRRSAGLGRRRGRRPGGDGSTTPSWRRSTAALAVSSFRRSTRASACRCSRRWPAARRS